MSRLEEIENDWFREDCIGNDNITWLIHQAQKAEELQAKVDELDKENKWIDGGWDTEIKMREKTEVKKEKLISENQRYKQALEEIKSLTINPREYQPSTYTIHHIVSDALKGVEG
ncbi:hypothetical protein [Oceanobacillus kimchii]|uniref:hypothetical protein n=1 Tax=Oceanobacillus kimchii TaxID=746691 RepID=UPI00232FD9F3|nr:hypothetical protein [Oceanobacillus kimchii]